jgi:2-keto-4-pentenoate hydratase/2-oxohepta-3-ene-1,7-dioic acid hydratase in catechol pathway
MPVTRWVRYECDGRAGFGTLVGDRVHEHRGELLGASAPTGRQLALDDVRLLMPTQPTKVIALWNNFGGLRAKLGLALPEEPLYLLKSPNSWCAPGDPIRAPQGIGKVVFEGELGIVIGRACSRVSEAQALEHVFGYTCGNDVTAAEILNRDPTFTQWTRAKGFDTFCPIGPAVASGLDPATLVVRTRLDGQVRQDYAVADMTFPVPRLVSRLSHDMTLMPGDLILCGTSLGVGSMKPGSRVEVEIEGIGCLANVFAGS